MTKAAVRIRLDGFYVLEDHPGISGFKDWNRKEWCIVTGLAAKNRRAYIAREYAPGASAWYRCDDGHLPEYQPRLTEALALEWLRANPYARITPCDPLPHDIERKA